MNRDTALRLNELTSDFYSREYSSFSQTRQRPWRGWEQAIEAIPPDAARITVLDVGCGNYRFERYLSECFPAARITVYAIDNCPQLATGNLPPNVHIDFRELDIIQALADGSITHDLPEGPCDLAVAFGVMHHIPLPTWREELLALLHRRAPTGTAAASFWQFMRDARLARQATRTTHAGCEELGISLSAAEGDYLLGWQGHPHIFRYCHSFTDDEVDALAAHVSKDAIVFGEEDDMNRSVLIRDIGGINTGV